MPNTSYIVPALRVSLAKSAFLALELLISLRIITDLFRGYRLSLLLLGRLVFRLLLRRLFLRCLRRFIAHGSI